MANPLPKRRVPHLTFYNPAADKLEERGCGLAAPDEIDKRTGRVREKYCTCGNNPVGPEDFIRINLPKAYWKATLARVPKDTRANVEKFLNRIHEAKQKGAGGYVYGPESVGKTGIGALIMIEARAWGYTAYCTTTSELREAVKERKPFDAEQSVWQRCQTVDFLLLDDLNTGDLEEKYNLSKWDIRNLVCNRKDKGLVTVVTSRLTVAKLDGLDHNFAYDIAVKCLAPLEVKGEAQPTDTDLFQ